MHVLLTNVSKVQIGNKEPVAGSFLTIIGFTLVSGFVYFLSILSARKGLNDTKELTLFICI